MATVVSPPSHPVPSSYSFSSNLTSKVSWLARRKINLIFGELVGSSCCHFIRNSFMCDHNRLREMEIRLSCF